MPRYLAEYTFEHVESPLRPKDQMYGQAHMELNLDKDIETKEEADEISKFIFKQIPDCNKVIVTKLRKIIEDGDVIEGDVVE